MRAQHSVIASPCEPLWGDCEASCKEAIYLSSPGTAHCSYEPEIASSSLRDILAMTKEVTAAQRSGTSYQLSPFSYEVPEAQRSGISYEL